MKKKSKFIFNEFKSIMIKELLIVDLTFANVNAACFISNLIKQYSRFKLFKA